MGSVPFNQVESHNSLLTNREMAILSSQIDVLALTAAQTLHYSGICAYFQAAEQYYKKLKPLVRDADVLKIDSLAASYYVLEQKIEDDVRYRTRRSLKLLLRITKDYYFAVRDSLQCSNYYFRTRQIRSKGLDRVSFHGVDDGGDDDLGRN